jgi:hypothetical protein
LPELTGNITLKGGTSLSKAWGMIDRAEPLKENLVDWRSDYLRTRVMIYNKIPSFEELMEFAKKLEVEFNTWVKENSGDIR